MESSFLEDFLKREVDQNQVNALVGNLENALGSSRSIVAPTGNPVNVSAGKQTSVGLISQAVSSQQQLITKSSASTVNKTASPKINGTDKHVIKNLASHPSSVTPKSSHISVSVPVPQPSIIRMPQPSIIRMPQPAIIRTSQPAIIRTPHPAIIRTPHSAIIRTQQPAMIRTQQPAIIRTQSPAGVISSSIHNGIMRARIPKGAVPIAPRLGNIMITPRQAQILMAQQGFANPALIRSNLIARMPGTIPVMPRIPGPGIAVPPVMNTQIPGLAVPRGAIINMGQKLDPRIIRMPLSSAAQLTQVKGVTSAVPGQVNYRFRQMNPTSIEQSAANGVANTNTTANVTMMRESVKRLKEFFQNLINLACGPNQPPEIGKMVKELVHNLMQGRLSEEEFIEKLQKTLKSDPQPNLVHFLKKTLPHLRETIKKQQMQQVAMKTTISGQNAVPANKIRPSLPTLNPPLTGNMRLPATPNQVVRKGLTIPEQMLQKQMLMGQLTATTGQTSAGMNTLLGMPQRGMAAAVGPKGLKGLQANQNKEKQKSTAYYSSATGADDDINDVTYMAGVNLLEESQKILSTGADFMSFQTRSIKDNPILKIDQLKKLVMKKAQQLEVRDVTGDALAVLSHATEQHMRNILERLTACCLHRNDPHKGEVRYETISDVRNQLRVFEEIDEVERKHRESREREILMRVAKSRSRTEDPEQARLKEKAKQMQLEEEETNRKRAANKTALEAIGGKKKKRKLDEALESLSQTSTSNAASSTTTSNTTAQNIRTRQHRITIKDLNLVLETERNTTKSLALYRSMLR